MGLSRLIDYVNTFCGQATMFSLDILLQPFTFDFMLRATVIALLVAIPTAILSCFLVLKGWSLMGDAVAHAVLPGVILAYLLGFPYIIGAFIAGMLCAITTGFISENSRLKEDTVMGVVFSSMFALGIVMMSKIESEVHLDHILFGDILGITGTDILITGAITLFSLLFLIIKGKDLVLYIFDLQHAKAIGLSIRLLHYCLLALLSITIVSALKAVGMILVIASLIAPGAIAYLITNRFKNMILISLIINSLCAVLGVYASFFIDSAPAPTIVVMLTIVFVIVFTVKTSRNFARQPGHL
jgi:manganese/iron transport system permease protein